MTRLLIRNGRVVDPSQGVDQGLEILLEDGVVAALAERVKAPRGVDLLDAGGLVVAPGFIDLCAHLREPGFEHKETIASGARAAVAGGFTAICAMPDTDPVNDNPSVTRFIRERGAEVGLARVYPVGAISKGRNGEEMAEIGEMAREGAVAFSEAGRPVANSLLMRRALEYARSFDVTLAVHAEDRALTDGGAMNEGVAATRVGVKGMPAMAEEVLVGRDLQIAAATRGRLHFSHLSTGCRVARVGRAKANGATVTCAVAAHHFLLTDEDLAASVYDPRFKTNPPLRTAADVEAVLHGIYEGTVDAIVSDHAPQHRDELELDFSDAPFGVVGLETVVSLAIDRLVHGRVIGLLQLVRLLSTNPAQIFGLPGGNLKVGSPADLTLLDLRRQVTVDPARFLSKARNTPFAGRRLRGAVAATIVGGKVVWKAGK